MISADKFRNACGEFDSDKCQDMLNRLPQGEAPRWLEAHVRESGCLIQPRISELRVKRRKKFVRYCRDVIAKSGDAELIAAFKNHLYYARLIEEGYREILSTLTNSPAGRMAPEVQVWAAIALACNAVQHLNDQIHCIDATQERLFDPVGAKVGREGGQKIDPDYLVNTVTTVLGNTLLMLAYENNWLENKQFTLPFQVEISEEMLRAATSTSYLGEVWRALKYSEERLRYFGGKVRKRTLDVKDPQGNSHKIRAIQFSHAGAEAELIERIAHERWLRLHFGAANEIELEFETTTRNQKPDLAIPLAPAGYLSKEEKLAFGLLENAFCYPVSSDTPVYKGLALKHWLRGYAVLRDRLARINGIAQAEIITRPASAFCALLCEHGMSEQQAEAFLEATTFSSGKCDLFDTPFLRGQGDLLHFFAPAYLAANLTNIIASFLGTNNVRFETKGKQFENKTLALLKRHDLPARGFNYKINGQQFECDAAFAWGNYLFVLECKNYGLSGLNTVASYHFFQKMLEAADQVERICAHFKAAPEIVKRHLGQSASWKTIVPCVLNAMPWAAGKFGESYIYDSSALTKFLDDGSLALVMPLNFGDSHHVEVRHSISIWEDGKPSAKALLKQFERPVQVLMLEGEWQVDAPLVLLSQKLGLIIPFLNRKEPDPKRTLNALGLSDEEISNLLINFENISQEARKIREEIDDGQD